MLTVVDKGSIRVLCIPLFSYTKGGFEVITLTQCLFRLSNEICNLLLSSFTPKKRRKEDMIARVMTIAKSGRSDCNSFFEEMANQRKGSVTVFFCGPTKLGRIIRSHCFGFASKKKIF